MSASKFHAQILELIRRTSAVPAARRDARSSTRTAPWNRPAPRPTSPCALVAQNIGLAKRLSAPICQDTGTITFYVTTPVGFDQLELEDVCKEAVAEATGQGLPAAELRRQRHRQEHRQQPRPRQPGLPLAPAPRRHGRRPPDPQGRRLREHERPVLAAGDARRQALRPRPRRRPRAASSTRSGRRRARAAGPASSASASAATGPPATSSPRSNCCASVDDTNPDPELAELEARILQEANTLDIGPMGFGGKLTVGGCKVGARNRLPASFFVSVAYMCWAYRRRGVVLDAEGEVVEWLYQSPGEFDAATSSRKPGRSSTWAARPAGDPR